MIGSTSNDFAAACNALYHPDNLAPVDNRNAVEAMLQRISNCAANDCEAVRFMQYLAQSILAAGGKGSPAAHRADRVLNATGMAGRFEHKRALVEVAAAIYAGGCTKAAAVRLAIAKTDNPHEHDEYYTLKALNNYLKKRSLDHVSKLWTPLSP